MVKRTKLNNHGSLDSIFKEFKCPICGKVFLIPVYTSLTEYSYKLDDFASRKLKKIIKKSNSKYMCSWKCLVEAKNIVGL